MTQEVQLICKCCRQPYYPDSAYGASWDAMILGVEKFAICALCGQGVPPKMFESYNYRSRWLRAVGKTKRKPI